MSSNKTVLTDVLLGHREAWFRGAFVSWLLRACRVLTPGLSGTVEGEQAALAPLLPVEPNEPFEEVSKAPF